MDVDYIAFATLMVVFGVVGMTATAHVNPSILESGTCNCIPSPEARLQELSAVVFAIGGVLLAIGLTKRPTVAMVPAVPQAQGMGYAAPPMRSGGLFSLGVSLVVLGVAVVAIPSFLVLNNPVLIAEGVIIVVLGALFAYRGGRSG